MMLIGGTSIRSGEMTIGDFVMYLSFTALMAMPVVQLANIGTQISEAFAGLDRIREIRRMATEDQEDAGLAPLPDVRGEVEFDQVTFEYNAGVPVLKKVSFHAPAGSTTSPCRNRPRRAARVPSRSAPRAPSPPTSCRRRKRVDRPPTRTRWCNHDDPSRRRIGTDAVDGRAAGNRQPQNALFHP